jgi:hypothetical protein
MCDDETNAISAREEKQQQQENYASKRAEERFKVEKRSEENINNKSSRIQFNIHRL